MPRTAIAVQTASARAGQDLTFVTVDAANGMQVPNDGRVFILVRCGAADAVTVAIPSLACTHGRTGDVTGIAVGNSVDKLFGPFPDIGGWGNGTTLFLNFSGVAGTPKIAAIVATSATS